MSSAAAVVQTLKDNDEDFEWYPTTDEILSTVKHDLDRMEDGYRFGHRSPSVLDCGAGDGRALMALTTGDRFAIEKSNKLLERMDEKIMMVGTDFAEQTLIDKKVDVIFCNPPYSEYEMWAAKIIKEANASVVYLVIPDRWESSLVIKAALEVRKSADEVKVMDSFDFLSADRSARAKVHLIRIQIGYENSRSGQTRTDPFSIWFDDNFKVGAEVESEGKPKETIEEAVKREIVKGGGYIQSLDNFYQRDLKALMDIHLMLSKMDKELLRELGVSRDSVMRAVQSKIQGLKDLYWKELFNGLDKITARLTSKKRKMMVEKLTSNMSVDFTVGNAYAITLWAVKNANKYFDEQFIEGMLSMLDKGNVEAYKSNQKTFGEENWRYSRYDAIDKLSHYQFEYRIVMDNVGGIANSTYDWENPNWGLGERASDWLSDLMVICNNLGYRSLQKVQDFGWTSGKSFRFTFINPSTDKEEILFEAKAFKNQNIHLRFNPKVMMRMNVEFGRLKGWVKTPSEASTEMGIEIEAATQMFERKNFQISPSSVLRIGNG